jgi:peptidoglycan/xylan/chitin deacetylase (PgdA/CDA1 family)
MRKSHLLAAMLHKIGAARALDAFWGPNRLTVLAYHRIAEVGPDFDHYLPNVSAAPDLFARQMDWVAQRFHVIDLAALRAFVEEGKTLPPRPLLITFDDGYLDNYQNAYPVLRAHGFPAVIFLITGKMDHPARPWWDECAYYFLHTPRQQATLPLIGPSDLSTPEQRTTAREALMRRLKTVPESEQQAALHALPDALGVSILPEPPLFVSWDQVRELVANGIACQPHTETHPILTRIPPDEARRQIAGSRARIAAETGQDVSAFAYPNGTLADYSRDTIQVLRETGYTLAFTLSPGPLRAGQVQRHPFEIPRVYLSRRDTLETFIMKVMGLPVLADRRRFVAGSYYPGRSRQAP